MTIERKAAISFAHPAYVRSIVDCLNSLGIQPTTVLDRAGLVWQDLCDGRKMVDCADFRRFAACAIQCSGDAALGLKAGSMFQPYHTPVGAAAVSAESLGQGLEFWCRHAHLIFGTLDFRLEIGAQWAQIRVAPFMPLCEAHVLVMQSVWGALCRLLEAMLGRPLREFTVGLPYSHTDDDEMFGLRHVRKVEFDQPDLTFWFPADLLPSRGAAPDPKAYAYAAATCHRMELELSNGSLVQRVSRALIERLPSNPDMGELASDLGVTPRTLVRRLAEAGATYTDIKDDIRRTHAAWYLQHTELSVEAIASQLGYSDPTNFSRKFKHWYSVAPTKMRQSLRFEAQSSAMR